MPSTKLDFDFFTLPGREWSFVCKGNAVDEARALGMGAIGRRHRCDEGVR